MKNYSSRRAIKNKTAFRTRRGFTARVISKIKKFKVQNQERKFKIF